LSNAPQGIQNKKINKINKTERQGNDFMKKIFIVPLALFLCFILCLNVMAASTYVITDKKTLQNFETGDPTEENYGGNTGWGSHWIDTELSAAPGLEGNVALQLKFSSDDGTIGGVHADNIGTSEEQDDWSAGKALLYRVKNLSNSSLNISTTIDVLDHSKGGDPRYRVWPEGSAQVLLDLSYNPADTVYADALASDGETKAGRDLYVVIPANFDGYILCDFSKYVDDVEQRFESIMYEEANPNWQAEVRHLVLLTQDCHGKTLVVDDFRLVDYELVEIAEPEEQPEAQGGGGDAPEQPVVPATPSAPKTGDAGIAILLLLCAAGGAAAIILKNRLSVK